MNNTHYEVFGETIDEAHRKILADNGLYAYDLRTWDFGNGSTIEEHVVVNWEGTVVLDKPIKFPKGQDYINDAFAYFGRRQCFDLAGHDRIVALLNK